MFSITRTAAALVLGTIAATALGGECSSLIPTSLQAALASRDQSFTMPLVVHSESLCVEDRRRAGETKCLLVARADFDGDDKEDVAVLMPSNPRGRGWQLVVALDRSTSWDIELVGSARVGDARNLMLSPLCAGEYRETEAVLNPGAAPRTIQSKHQALQLGACDSWATGYFRADGRWVALALSD